jgi:uncharacterized protein involved in propanediol utilization
VPPQSEEIARKRAAAEREKLRLLGEQERLKAEMAAMEEMQAAKRAAVSNQHAHQLGPAATASDATSWLVWAL